MKILLLKLEEFSQKNLKVVSNSHLGSRVNLKKKNRLIKMQGKRMHLFRHGLFDTVFLHPFQKKFIVKFLNDFEYYLEKFSKNRTKKNSVVLKEKEDGADQNGEVIDQNGTENKLFAQELTLESFVEQNKQDIYKNFLTKIKRQLAPFDTFYSEKKDDRSVPYQSVPQKNENPFNSPMTRVVRPDHSDAWLSLKNKEVPMVQCQNESIFEEASGIYPVKIKGIVQKRIKKIYKGIEKKNYPELDFLAQDTEFLFITLNAKDLISRILFFFWEFILDFSNLEIDKSFLRKMMQKIQNRREIFYQCIKEIGQGNIKSLLICRAIRRNSETFRRYRFEQKSYLFEC